MDGEHIHICVVCQRHQYEREHVCEPCRGRLAWQPREITGLWQQLLDTEPEPDPWRQLGEISRRLGKWTHDPVTDAVPSGPVRRSTAAPVTGTRAPQPPIDLDGIDLVAPARTGTVHDPARLQTGHLSVPTVLDEWVRDIRDTRGLREHLPVPTVPELCAWLSRRTDWIADHHPAADEYAGEMSRLIAVMRGVLNLTTPRPVLCEGVACPRCGMRVLYRGETEYVECAGCGRLLRDDEYHEAVAEQAQAVRAA